MDPGRADDFWTGSLAALFGVRVCPPEEQIWAAGLPFCGGNVCRMSSDGSGAGGFLPGGGIFREEHENGVVLQGTVQSVKEKDGTLEVALRTAQWKAKMGSLVRSFEEFYVIWM